MREIVYTMHFRGQASHSGEEVRTIKTTSSGTSCTMNTVVGESGVETTLQPAPGDLAFLESELRLTGQDTFEGSGSLTFGDEGEHAIQFTSIHAGQLGPSPQPGLMAGTVTWRVVPGSGRFAAATGFITSTFTLSDSGELSEYHCGLLFLPE